MSPEPSKILTRVKKVFEESLSKPPKPITEELERQLTSVLTLMHLTKGCVYCVKTIDEQHVRFDRNIQWKSHLEIIQLYAQPHR